jgi:hypothetical protein
MKILQTAACTLVFAVSAFAQQAATPATPKQASPTPQQPSSAAEPAIKPPANPITPAQIKEMQELTGAPAMQKRIVSNAMQFYRSQFPPYVPQDVVEDLQKSLEKADLESQAAEIYPKYLSTEDAAKVIEFYKSPAGQHLVTAQPYMMTEMQRSSVQIAQQTAKDVIERHKPEIEAAQQKYMEEHQQAKPSLNTQPSPSSPSTTTPPKQ